MGMLSQLEYIQRKTFLILASDSKPRCALISWCSLLGRLACSNHLYHGTRVQVQALCIARSSLPVNTHHEVPVSLAERIRQ